MNHEKVWDNLNRETRMELLTYVYPSRSESLREFESRLDWEELLPSTQQALTDEDWSEILGREL